MTLGVKIAAIAYAELMSIREVTPHQARKRRAVQADLTEIAQELFASDGYEATTVEGIAAAAGMSKRTFFRYFSSKESLVVGKYELFGERLAEALVARPIGEDVWESLRRVFDIVVEQAADEARWSRTDQMQRIIHSTPALHAAYLEKFDGMQAGLVRVIRDRAEQSGLPFAPADPSPDALVGAAFACLQAANRTQVDTPEAPFATTLDAAMAALRPT
jgi:AcrR family transcriptional regulator